MGLHFTIHPIVMWMSLCDRASLLSAFIKSTSNLGIVTFSECGNSSITSFTFSNGGVGGAVGSAASRTFFSFAGSEFTIAVSCR